MTRISVWLKARPEIVASGAARGEETNGRIEAGGGLGATGVGGGEYTRGAGGV
jgi:hypothetical protein